MEASLQDLELELWLRSRDNNNIVWTTKEGKKVPINKMGTVHLYNTINMLRRQEAEDHTEDCFSIY